VSRDGRIVGTVDDLSVGGEWSIGGVTVKIDKTAVDLLGKKKPLLRALRMDIGVAHIKAIRDNVVLDKDLREVGEILTKHDKSSNASRLLRMEIMDSHGTDVGKVEEILVDNVLWAIPSLLMTVRRNVLHLIKVKKPLLAEARITLPTSHVSSVGDVVVLDITADELGQLFDQAPVKKL
jgi:sporulation protein YlmC with PRC-barrel domain